MRRDQTLHFPNQRPTLHGNKKGQVQIITLPLVIQSAWDDGRGNVGIFAVNTQRREAVVKVSAPGAGSWRATFYTGAKPGRTQAVFTGQNFAWSLAPDRLEAIVFTADE